MYVAKRFWMPFVVMLLFLLTACNESGNTGTTGTDDTGSNTDDTASTSPAPTPPSAPIVVTPMVVGGGTASFALKRDGTVVAWGDQQNGALGNGETKASSTRVPQSVLNLSSITQIAAGDSHGLARRSDGAVFAWGVDTAGQLGVGGAGIVATPVQLSLANVTAVAAGFEFSLALRNDGVVFAWGDNSAGQLGLNDTNARLSPVQVPNLSNVVAISAGGSHALAIRNDGTVFAWGNNGDGQLGLNDSQVRLVPTHVTALDGLNVKQVAAGQFHSLALTANGKVFGWGSSLRGEAGGGFGNIFEPLENPDLTGVAVAIAAGARHSLAILNDGTMRTWGDNGSGRLGNGSSGSTSSSTFLPQDPQLDGVVAIGAGKSHSLIIVDDGRVGCFGDNFFSQCGQPAGFSELTTPTEVGSPVLNVNE